jgi:hypothetical protein
MNPVTQSLLNRIQNPELARFISCWDALEALAIEVFRSKQASPQDELAYRQIQDCVRRRYPPWRKRLRPLWQKTQAAGQSIQQDPFMRLVQVEQVGVFAEDWSLVQTLPAAREAINQLLLDLIDQTRPKSEQDQ